MASSSKALTPKKVVTLATIDPDNETSSILVKVLRKWQVFSRNGGNSPMATELVLADSEVYLNPIIMYKLLELVYKVQYYFKQIILMLKSYGYFTITWGDR